MTAHKIITKTYATIRQAERFQNSLYNQYEGVRLVKSPPGISEQGVYIWQVSSPIPSPGEIS